MAATLPRLLDSFRNLNPHSRNLLKQYWRALDARHRLFEARDGNTDPVLQRMRTLLGADPSEATWDGVFQADLLTPRFLKGEELELDFRSRLTEGRQESRAESKPFWDLLEAKWKAVENGTDEAKRAVVQETAQHSMWEFAIQDQERNYRSKTILWSAIVFIASLLALLSILKEGALNLTSWGGSWYVVAVAGACGASFSWLARMRETVFEKSLDSLKDLSRWYYTLSRAFIGLGAAVVLFWAFRGGFLSGPMFPVLDVTRSESGRREVVQAFRALVQTTTGCDANGGENRDARIAATVESFNALLTIQAPDPTAGTEESVREAVAERAADRSDYEWLRLAGLRPAAAHTTEGPPATGEVPDDASRRTASLVVCSDAADLRTSWLIRNALHPGAAAVALLLFWSFVAGFSETLVPSLLDRAGGEVDQAGRNQNGRGSPAAPGGAGAPGATNDGGSGESTTPPQV